MKVDKLYLGVPKAHWPRRNLDLDEEMKRYETAYSQMKQDFADVDFVVNQLVSKPKDLADVPGRIQESDGVLLIHLSMGSAASSGKC